MSTNPRLRFVVVGLALAFLFLVANSGVAAQRVITIYFHGTGASLGGPQTALVDLYFQDHSTEIEWANIELAPCLAGMNGQGGPEARLQIEVVVRDTAAVPGSTHYKYSVEGFGATLEPMVACLAEFADPGGVTAVRTWNQVTGEAVSAIRAVIEANGDGDRYVINLVGHSRGGVMTLKTARAAVDASDLVGSIDRINILAYDPVPGIYDPILYFGNAFELSPKVRNYVGLYCKHDRRFMFEPIIPYAASGDTRVWIETIPGSHTDLVLSSRPHKDVGLGIGEQLLDSPEWGNVPVDPMSSVDSEATFLDATVAMNEKDYTATENDGNPTGFPWLLGCHPDAMIRASTPSLYRNFNERICYAAPYRHEPHWGLSWPWECGLVYYNAEQVFWLSDRVGPLGSGDWAILQYMRGLSDSPIDTVPPVPRVPNLPPIYVDCPPVTVPVPVADDVVSRVIYGTTPTRSFSSPGTYEITWSYKDGAGNISTQTQTVIVRADTEPPVLTIPEDVVRVLDPAQTQCEVFIPLSELGSATAIDHCGPRDVHQTPYPPTGSLYSIGVTTFTYSAADLWGNTASGQQQVTVTFTAPPDVVVDAVPGACEAVVNDAGLGQPLLPRDCSGRLTIERVPAGNRFPVGETSVIWTATDRTTGASATAVQRVLVRDATPPVIQAPASLTLSTGPGATSCKVFVDDAMLGTATASDNCPASIVERSGVPQGNLFPVGTTTIHYTATDRAGNTATATQLVSVIDDTPPVITLNGEAATTMECQTGYSDPGARATDNCAGDLTPLVTVTGSVDVNTPGTYTLTYNVTDPTGTSAAPVTRTVIVRDTKAPSLTLNGPTQTTIECHTSYADPGAQATDSCAGDLTNAISVTGSVDANRPGTYVLTYAVADPSGNAAVPVTRTVTVRDTTAPSIALNGAAEMTIECHTSYSDPGAQATESCAGDLTNAIKITGTVDVNTPGTYRLEYNVADPSGNAAIPVTRTVVVQDTTRPTITSPPAAKEIVGCSAAVPDFTREVAASDVCSSALRVSQSPAAGTVVGVGAHPVTITVADASGNSAAAATTFTVINNPPAITTPTTWTVAEGSEVTLTASAVDPDGSAVLVAWDLDNDGIFETPGASAVFRGSDGPATHVIAVRATDPCGLFTTAVSSVSVTNVPPKLGAISGSTAAVPIGTALTLTVPFSDAGSLDTHTGTWSWDDGSTSPATISGSGGNGTAQATHSFGAAGVYRVTLELKDDDGGSGIAVLEYVIVFDADAGFVTGGGWIDSLPGAYAPDATLTGKANFGFNAKYQKESTVPPGDTEFHFAAAHLTLRSTAYQWLVVAGAKAQFKGSGTMDGADCEFLLTVTDGDAPEGGGKDRIRIKIWDRNSSVVLYDNVRGAPDDIDAASPQEISGGSIQVHVK